MWVHDMALLLRRGPLGIEDAQPLLVQQVTSAIAYTFEHLAEPSPGGFCWADQIRSPSGLRKKYQQIRDARRTREAARANWQRGESFPPIIRYDNEGPR